MRIVLILFILFAGGAIAAPYHTIPAFSESLNRPWALTALPSGGWLVTERAGTLVHITQAGTVNRYPLDLSDLYDAGQGGLLDVAVADSFGATGTIVLTYAAGTAQANQLTVATARLSEQGVSQLTPILQVQPAKATPVHFGGRLVQLPDKTWLVTTGDGFDYREQAQVLTSRMGKILRFQLNGEPVANPPFAQAPFVHSLGHRNPQGLVVVDNTVYAHEHGPDGGDEINIIQPGQNYGWPVVTNGDDYSGARISPFRDYPGMQAPLYDWTPSVAPSAMVYYQHSRWPHLQNKLMITTLKQQAILAVDIAANPVQAKELKIAQPQRWRDIAVNAVGQLFLLPDGEHVQILQLQPPAQ